MDKVKNDSDTRGFLMGGQISLARESTMAYLTYIRPLPRVSPPMYRQSRPLAEGFRALIALVRLLTGMHASVHPQVLRVGESLAAYIADVGFLARMYPPVFLQMFRAAEALATKVAEVEFRRIVALLVPEQRALRGENTAADVARGARDLLRLQLGM